MRLHYLFMELAQRLSAHLFSFHSKNLLTIISTHDSSLGVESEQHSQSRLSPFSDELSPAVDTPGLSDVSPALPVPVTPVPSVKAHGKKKATAAKDVQ